jgi:hypothetical protein
MTMKSASHTRLTDSTNAWPPENRSSTIEAGHSLRVEESSRPESTPLVVLSDIRSFELVRRFVEHMVAKNSPATLGNDRSSLRGIDWETIEASVADSRSFEQAIGRALLIADQMCRGVFEYKRFGEAPSNVENPFFPFSVADVIPDFGDESRYRTKVARKVGRIFGTRRTAVSWADPVSRAMLPEVN